MKKKYFLILNILILSMGIFSKSNAQSSASINEKESARLFVQKFYTWSFPLFKAEPEKNQLSDQEIIMKHSKEFFSQHLRKALENYYGTPRKDGDIGLDFDPFMAGQDYWPGYETGNVKQEGSSFFVDVHSIEKGASRKAVLAAELIVVAEVTKESGQWVIANFIYADSGSKFNLLGMLKNQAKG